MIVDATSILSIPETDPGRLFDAPDQMEDAYKALMKRWHPDINQDPIAGRVTAHITQLFQAAKKMIGTGVFHVPGRLELAGVDKVIRRIAYAKKHTFELGSMFYGAGTVTFVISNEYADLFENSRRRIDSLQYADDKMEHDIYRYMPQTKARFETKSGDCVLVLKKTADVFLLQDVVDHFGGRIDPKHVAWIMNCLYNLACFMESPFNRATHNGITTKTVFISPLYHSALLLGGWWYAKEQGSQMNTLPPEAYSLAPREMLRDKKAGMVLDLTMIKAVGRAMLGDVTGMTFPQRTDAPKPMLDFLRRPTSGIAVSDYLVWSTDILPASYGERRFVKLDVSASDIFKGV